MDDAARAALADLLSLLRAQGYRFITPTPATHARIVARDDRQTAQNARDIFGWNLPFDHGLLSNFVLSLLQTADALDERDGLLRSKLRVSSLGEDLFLHSAFPTAAQDAVFFGPDSYRFANFIARELPRLGKITRLVDVGCGTGVGAIAALHAAEIAHIVLTDINQAAIDMSDVNTLEACAWGALEPGSFDLRLTDSLDGIVDPIDVIIANPPYIADPAHRAYRDGGGMHGGELSVRWARDAAERLAPGGKFLLYTGSAIIDGEDVLKSALREALRDFDVRYEEIDPDAFGEELEREDYADVERIAVVGVVAIRR